MYYCEAKETYSRIFRYENVNPDTQLGQCVCEILGPVYKNYAVEALVFTHKTSKYWPGLSSLQLAWRDRHLSRFFVDNSDQDGDLTNLPEKQTAVLRISKDEISNKIIEATQQRARLVINDSDEADQENGGYKISSRVKLETWDGVVLLNNIPGIMKPNLVNYGQLCRVQFEKIEDSVSGDLKIVGLGDISKVPPTRVFPDSSSRVLVQNWRRSGVLKNNPSVDKTATIQEILDVANNPTDVEDVDVGPGRAEEGEEGIE